ncbi:MAG: oligosaccharide flippase family protein [Candidatus Didemnitutus sp.]|nr:oligosaccharide flippase family protein [Candidatus Didemnitutus sp.]
MISRLKLSDFSRNVLVILTGTIAAQAIGILVSPVLTRLYDPADFGVYALFVSLTALLGSVVCARYEYAITLPAEHRQGLALLALCTLIAFGFGLLLLPVIWLLGDALVVALKEPRLAAWLWYVPGALFVTGFATAARYWLLRMKEFRMVSFNGVLRAVVAAVFNIALGVWGFLQFGLIGGLLLGLVVSTVFLGVHIWRESAADLRQLRWSDLRAQAYAQRGFPLYSTGSAVVESGAAQVPVFFFSSLFGATTLGLFSLAQRMANLPLSLVAGSVGDVFRQQASAEYARDGNCLALFDRTFKRLFWMSLPAFVLAAWLSPWVFALVFGAEWKESGEYVRLLVPALGLRFVSSPLSSMFFIAQRQGVDLGVQVVLIITMVSTFLWAGRTGSGWTANHAIMAYSGIYSVKYLFELVMARRFARGKAAQ